MPDPATISSPRVLLALVYDGQTAQLTADLIASPQPNNAVELLDDGLFVSQSAIEAVASLPVGVTPGTLRILTTASGSNPDWLCIASDPTGWQVIGAPLTAFGTDDVTFTHDGGSAWHGASDPQIIVPAAGVYNTRMGARYVTGDTLSNFSVGLSVNAADPDTEQQAMDREYGTVNWEFVSAFAQGDVLNLTMKDTSPSGSPKTQGRYITLTPISLS